jgi:peptidoglycan/LPS O-acetylase OafA/YrhL
MKPTAASPGYLPGLNGLRALAAGAVLFLHVNDNMQSLGLPFPGRTDGGHFAVTVFFALSGFLITYLLLREKERTQQINIFAFYMRRTLRIWPLYFAFFGVALLFNWATGTAYSKLLIPFYILFAANIPFSANTFMPNAAHLWSLGVEEQFYLIWPWCIRIARKPIYFLLGFFVGFLLLKVAFRFLLGGLSEAYLFLHVTRFDCMALGGIGAWLYWSGIPETLKRLLFSIPMQLACWLALAATIPDRFHFFTIMEHTTIALASVILMLNLVANPKPLLRLENRFWRYIGGISFGLYIWHPILAAANALLVPYLPLPAAGKIAFLYIAVLGETLLLAHLSMQFLEGPFLKLKQRFSA